VDLQTLKDGLREEIENTVAAQLAKESGRVAGRAAASYYNLGAQDDGGFSSFGEFLRCISNPRFKSDSRLKTAGHLQEGEESQGGFLVPEQFLSGLLFEYQIENALLPLTHQVPMSSDQLRIPSIDETDRSGGELYGGISVYWVAEATEKTLSKPTFRQNSIAAHKVCGLTYASDQLLEDSAQTENIVKRLFGNAIQHEINRVLIKGTGVGQPLGILTSGALLVQTSTSSAGTLNLVDLAGMYSKLMPGSHGTACWLAAPSVLPMIFDLASKEGATAGGFNPLHITDSAKSPSMFLMGIPIIISPFMEQANAQNDLVLVDFSQYLTGVRKQLEVSASPHIRFQFDETAFRFVFRIAGQPGFSSYLTMENSDQVSFAVTLSVRGA